MKIIAIDIGGTEIKGALMDPSILKEFKVDTDLSEGKKSILRSLYSVIDALLFDDVQAISIVTAGTINVDTTSIIYNAGVMPGWVNFNLGETVEDRYSIKVYVENDANGAMIAEMQSHLENGVQNAVMITLGTGVGTAIFTNGKLYRGDTYKVEFGHMILHPKGRVCTCGIKGCVEQYVSGSALTKTAINILGSTIVHGSQVFDLVSKGNHKAEKILNNYIDDLALFLYNVNRILDPEIIIIGGGVIQSKAILLPRLIKALEPYEMYKQILPAKDGNFAGIKGAYFNAYERMIHRG